MLANVCASAMCGLCFWIIPIWQLENTDLPPIWIVSALDFLFHFSQVFITVYDSTVLSFPLHYDKASKLNYIYSLLDCPYLVCMHDAVSGMDFRPQNWWQKCDLVHSPFCATAKSHQQHLNWLLCFIRCVSQLHFEGIRICDCTLCLLIAASTVTRSVRHNIKYYLFAWHKCLNDAPASSHTRAEQSFTVAFY